MGVFSNNAITDGGRVLLSYVEMGAIFTPTKIVMGSGTLPAGTTVRTIKDVVAPVKTLTIGKKKRGNDGTVTIGGVYSNQDVTADFYFRELALYARADNQDGSVAAEECLYSYGNAGSTADLMPAYSSGQPVERQIDLVIYVGNDSNVDLTIASGTAMTVEMGEQMVDGLRKEVVQALEGKAEKTHTHTSKDITGLDEAMSGALEGKADKEHTHTKKDITDFPESMPASDVYDWAKQPNKPVYTAGEVGARPSTWTPKLHDVAYLGENPVKSTADDTTSRWANLGSGYAWYSAGGLLNDQPAQYGFLLNYVNGSDVFQIWNTQSNGPMYTRSGNASGWGRSWTKLIDSSSIGSQTVNKAKYASGQSSTGAVLRNEALYTSDTTPTANGQINWTYG